MTNASRDRKISNFLGATSVTSGAYFTYIVNNTNYKILDTDFYAALGVTGTIVQDGAVTGTPVLDTAGTVNNIRNLEDGSGIKTSVSAENGITVEHNFIEDTAGVELVEDLSAAQPNFRSLVAGSGINIAGSGGEIQIALSATPASTKTVIVNSISDFPAAVGGIITLEDDTEYAVRNDITTANRFVLGNNCVLSGSDEIVTAMTYTDIGVMFTSVNATWKAKNLTLICSSGTLLDIDGVGTEVFRLHDCTIIADTVGSIGGINGAQIDGIQFQVTTDGLVFTGALGIVLIEDILASVSAGILFDLDSATFDAISFDNNFVVLAAGSIFLSGLASSGNLNAGGLGTVHNSRFFGAGTPLQNITPSDIRWQFALNDDIPDTHQDSLMSLNGNATATVIAAINTPTLILGTWSLEHAAFFTQTTDGRSTYDGLKDIHIDVTATFSAAPVSGSNKIIGFYVVVNGTEIDESEVINNISAGDLSNTTIMWRAILSPGDYVECFVENETDAVNVLVTDAVIRIS